MRRSFKAIPWLALTLALIPFQAKGLTDAGLSDYEIYLPDPRVESPYEPQVDQALSLANPKWQSFIGNEGGGWIVTVWSRETELPAFAVGPGIELGLATSPTQEALESAGRAFIANHSELFGVGPEDLVLNTHKENGRKQYILFEQHVNGIPVVQGWVHMNFMDGRLVAFGSQAYPDVDVVSVAGISREQAARAASLGLPWNEATDVARQSQLVVLPVTWAEGATSYYLAYEIMLETEEPMAHWRTFVDATDGEILSRRNELGFGTFAGNVVGDVHPSKWIDPIETFPFKEDRIDIDGGGSVHTDADGDYSGTGPDTQTTVTANMVGRYARVYDDNGGGYDLIEVQTGPGNDIDFHWQAGNTDQSERDCYYHSNIVHDWVKSLDPGFTSMDNPTLCRVDIDGDQCNAFWNGNSINFYNAGASCVNMAELPDVIYHEYQHGITQYTYSPNSPPTSSGMGEALSDYAGMTIIDDPILGEGWHYGSGFVRTGENGRQYPATECGTEVHCKGEVLMGALWKTRVALVEKYGHEAGVLLSDQLFRETVKSKKYSMPLYLSQMLVEDDDNGNTADGTPDYYEICDNFARHNLICPPITIYVDIAHTPLEDTSNTTSPYEVVADITSVGAGPIDPGSAEIHYSTDGVNYSTVAMSNTGGDTYSGDIPAQPGGTVVDYYIQASTTDGISGTHPPRAPEIAVNQFMTGSLTEKLGGGLENNTGWVESAVDDDATDGFWEWGDPVGKTHPTDGEVIQPEDDHTPGGVNCYITRNLGGFWSNGNVDNGKVTLFTPAMDFSAGSGGGFLEFWFFMADWTTPGDKLLVQISDDGTNWIPLTSIEAISRDLYNEWTYRKFYFREADVDFTSNVQVRFITEDKPNNSVLEVCIDDVVVKIYDEGAADVVDAGLAPTVFRVDGNRPNPFNPRTVLRYQIPSAGRVQVEVYNVAGERVRVLVNEAQPAGVHNVVFDGRSDGGKDLPSGLYFARVRAGSKESTFPMTLLK